DPAPHLLHDPERGQEARLLGRVPGEERIQPLAIGSDEHRFVGCPLGGGAVGACLLCGHRSTSPITMSTLALMAMTSDSNAPSHIFGRLARLMNDGGRIR